MNLDNQEQETLLTMESCNQVMVNVNLAEAIPLCSGIMYSYITV
jgi:hypothetical protein